MILTRGQRAVESWRQDRPPKAPLYVCFLSPDDNSEVTCRYCGMALGKGHGATLEKGKIGRG